MGWELVVDAVPGTTVKPQSGGRAGPRAAGACVHTGAGLAEVLQTLVLCPQVLPQPWRQRGHCEL